MVICEIRLRAERKAGELLATMEKAKAGPPVRNRSVDATDYRGAPTLHDLGISRDQSSRWQKRRLFGSGERILELRLLNRGERSRLHEGDHPAFRLSQLEDARQRQALPNRLVPTSAGEL
jgi:hypothetical protein